VVECLPSKWEALNSVPNTEGREGGRKEGRKERKKGRKEGRTV
jgi:hypothetical protein